MYSQNYNNKLKGPLYSLNLVTRIIVVWKQHKINALIITTNLTFNKHPPIDKTRLRVTFLHSF